MAHGHTRMFIRQLLKNPSETGAIMPSSRKLAARMLELSGPAPDSVVAEYGPGTGAFTRAILDALQPDQKFFCVEINEDFARRLRKETPDLSVHVGCASRIAEYLKEEGLDHVDRVISGLPWAVFPDGLQRKILDAMIAVMPKGGVFVTFAYLQGLIMPSGRLFRKNLGRRFPDVRKSGVVWENVPPAIVYRCEK
ncbi:MAG: ribosomal RNA adenine dimethylase domain-containing protein [Planctomycetota bacterium]|nr:ribosomal RNA adenine dimethylase domain-containing protein [Planctomycetota bacterium]